MRNILYFVSGHGFGHAVRSTRVVRELSRQGFRCHVASASPRYIFDCNLKGIEYEYHKDRSDIGVVQRTSLYLDLPATLTAWRDYLDRSEEWIEGWLVTCRTLNPVAIVGDIVPLAFALGRRAAIPSFLVTTFTWDWILDFYRDDDPAFAKLAEKVRRYYAMPDHLIHTPLTCNLPKVADSTRVPLIGKTSCRSPEEIRALLGLDERPAFLVTFGGCGVGEVERMQLERMTDYQFLFLSERGSRSGNVITFSVDEAVHEDLVAVSRAVITKPGYGISCETILNRIPMIYTSRGKFAEFEPLVAELKTYIPTRYVPQEALYDGALKPFLDDPPTFDGDYRTDPGTGGHDAAAWIASRL